VGRWIGKVEAEYLEAKVLRLPLGFGTSVANFAAPEHPDEP